jgi:hypothetical protein
VTIDLMASPTPGPVRADPVGQVRALFSLCEKLGLRDELAASRRLLARGEELGAAARAAQARARERYRQTVESLFTQQDIDTDAIAQVLVETAPWLDANLQGPAPYASSGMTTMMEAAKQTHGRAGAMLQADAPGIYAKLQKVAAGAVAATAALPELPRSVWSSPQPAAVAVREGHGETMKRLWEESDRFDTCHQAGRICRSSGGLGTQAMLDNAPEPLGFTVRNWQKAGGELQDFKLIRAPLRLRWMVDRGWEPGLWLRDDLRQAEQQRRGSRLRALLAARPG